MCAVFSSVSVLLFAISSPGLCGLLARVRPVRYERGKVHCIRDPACLPVICTWIIVTLPRGDSTLDAVVGVTFPGAPEAAGNVLLTVGLTSVLNSLTFGDCKDKFSAFRLTCSISAITSTSGEGAT